jgi:hypothetical protein
MMSPESEFIWFAFMARFLSSIIFFLQKKSWFVLFANFGQLLKYVIQTMYSTVFHNEPPYVLLTLQYSRLLHLFLCKAIFRIAQIRIKFTVWFGSAVKMRIWILVVKTTQRAYFQKYRQSQPVLLQWENVLFFIIFKESRFSEAWFRFRMQTLTGSGYKAVLLFGPA